MDKSENDVTFKLDKVLTAFLKFDHTAIVSDAYLELIITHLSGKNGEGNNNNNYNKIKKRLDLINSFVFFYSAFFLCSTCELCDRICGIIEITSTDGLDQKCIEWPARATTKLSNLCIHITFIGSFD